MTDEEWGTLTKSIGKRNPKPPQTLQELEAEVNELKKEVISAAERARLLAEREELLQYIEIGNLGENATEEQINSLLKKAEELR